MHRNSFFRFTILTLLVAVGILPVHLFGETPREILEISRIPGREGESLGLLEKNLSASGDLRPYFLLELARLSAHAAKWDKALIWSLQQDLADIPPAIADEVIYWRCEALVQNNQSDAAIDLYLKRLKSGLVRDPRLYLAYFRIGTTNAETFTARFDADFPLLKSTDPETFALSRYLGGITAVRAGNWEFAVLSFSRFSPLYDSRFPELAPWSRYYRAYGLYRLGKWSEATAEFTVYLDLWKNHSFSWQAATSAAFSAMQSGSDALPFAERAVQLAPTTQDLADSVLFQASLLIDRKQYTQAESLLSGIADGKRTKGLTAASPRALFMLADIAFRQKNPELAEKRRLALVSTFPNDVLADESLYRAAEQWYITGEWERSSALFAKYRQSRPSGRFLDSVLWSGGDSYYRLGNTDLAILWWQELIKKYPQSPSSQYAYRELVGAFRKKGEYASAVKSAELYKKQYPAESGLDQIDAEIAELTKLSRGENPDAAALHTAYVDASRSKTAAGRSTGLRLARLYLADFSRHSDAKEILLEITASMPRAYNALSSSERNVFASAWSLLGNVYRDESNYKSASQAFLLSGTLYAPIDGERSAEAMYGAADCFIQSGQRADAVTTLETLTKTWPHSVWTRRGDLLLE